MVHCFSCIVWTSAPTIPPQYLALEMLLLLLEIISIPYWSTISLRVRLVIFLIIRGVSKVLTWRHLKLWLLILIYSTYFHVWYVQGTLEQWQAIFLILAGILVFGSLFFGYFADSEVETWNTQNTKGTECEDKIQRTHYDSIKINWTKKRISQNWSLHYSISISMEIGQSTFSSLPK